MKLSNFKLINALGTSPADWVFIAEVDVTTGILWWRRTVRRRIRREYADYWYFEESGKFAPETQALALARAWTAKTGQAT